MNNDQGALRPVRIFVLSVILFLLPVLACNLPSGGNTEEEQQVESSSRSEPALGSNSGSLTLGEVTTILVQQVGTEGGTLVVNRAGDPLDGLSVQVPAGAYPDGTTLVIESQAIEEHSFGPDFNPVSPLIKIHAGETLAEGFVALEIPAQIEPDEFGMAFSYERQKDEIEGLPLIKMGPDGLRIATRDVSREIIVSTVKKARLDGDILTGFEHGIDDWQFPNYGSAISPKGHCAGQSLSAMYYFIEELGPPLFGQYDNYDNAYIDTPELAWDDEQAYRLASAAQESLDWESAGRWFWELFGDEHLDAGVYNAFAYSMLLTKAPQFAGIYNEDGGGHAMIVYGKRGNSLLISDPNYPINSGGGAEDRFINFNPENEKFEPYYSGPNAAEKYDPYDTIYYFGYKDIIDWEALGTLWEDLESGVVGSDQFPAYRLMVRDRDSDVEEALWDNHEAEDQEIIVRVEAGFAPYLFVYHADAKIFTDSREPISINLQDGDNMLGFEIHALDEGGQPNWVGFDWVKIIYEGDEEGSTVENEMKYEGTYSSTSGGCTSSGDFEFYVYASGSVSAGWRKTADSCSASSKSTFMYHSPGTHEDGRFTIQVNPSFELVGTFNEDSMSCNSSNENSTFEASAVRVP